MSRPRFVFSVLSSRHFSSRSAAQAARSDLSAHILGLSHCAPQPPPPNSAHKTLQPNSTPPTQNHHLSPPLTRITPHPACIIYSPTQPWSHFYTERNAPVRTSSFGISEPQAASPHTSFDIATSPLPPHLGTDQLAYLSSLGAKQLWACINHRWEGDDCTRTKLRYLHPGVRILRTIRGEPGILVRCSDRSRPVAHPGGGS